MKVWRDFSEIPPLNDLMTATIGNFDGLHLGHMFLLKKLREKASESGHKTLVITYSNSPLKVLRPELAEKHLITFDQKIHLFRDAHIDHLLLLTFTKDFSEQSFDKFLAQLLEKLPIRHFVFGYDTTFGKDKSGTKENVLKFLAQKNVTAEYIEPLLIDGKVVSSRGIRQLLEKGDLASVEKLLGRPFTIAEKVVNGAGRGGQIGFATANLDVAKLCTPPLGVYIIKADLEGQHYFGIANLGIRPTFEKIASPILEVHLFDFEGTSLYGKTMRVQFLHYIRAEKKFENKEALIEQIRLDVTSAKNAIRALRDEQNRII